MSRPGSSPCSFQSKENSAPPLQTPLCLAIKEGNPILAAAAQGYPRYSWEDALRSCRPAACRVKDEPTASLNLAAAYGDRLLLLHDGRVAALGPPAEVLRRELLEPVFGCRLIVERGEPDNMLRVLPLPARHGCKENARSAD